MHTPGIGLHYYCMTHNGAGNGGTNTWQTGSLSGFIMG